MKRTYRLTIKYIDAVACPFFQKCYYIESEYRANSNAWLEQVMETEKAEGLKFTHFVNCATDYVGDIKEH